MKVVRVLPDHSLKLLGYCDDFRPPKVHGDILVVRRRPPSSNGLPTLPAGVEQAAHYPCTLVTWTNGLRDVVVEDVRDGPPVQWLPGWRPA